MKKIVVLIVVLFSAILLQAKGDMHLFTVDNKAGKITPNKIEDVLSKNGFSVDLNSEMNSKFIKQFQKTTFKVFTLITVHHKILAAELINKYPQAGVFTPMGVAIYQSKNEDTLHVSILSADAQAKILGIKDTKILSAIEDALIKALKKALPEAKIKESRDSLKESRKLVTMYEMDLDGEDWEEAKEEFEMNLEGSFNPFGFIIAATQDLTFLDEDKIETKFDFYDTYSICKLKVIYTVSQSRPNAAAFAP